MGHRLLKSFLGLRLIIPALQKNGSRSEPPASALLSSALPLLAGGKEDLQSEGLQSPHPHPREVGWMTAVVRALEVQMVSPKRTAGPSLPHPGASAPDSTRDDGQTTPLSPSELLHAHPLGQRVSRVAVPLLICQNSSWLVCFEKKGGRKTSYSRAHISNGKF